MKKIRNIILTFVLMFIMLGVAKAEELINLDTINIKVEGINDRNQQSAYVRIYDADFVSGKDYAVTFTKDATSIKPELSITDDYSYVQDLVINGEAIENAGFSSVTYLKYAEKYGNMYVTFYISNSEKPGYYKKISEPILIEKPEDLKISRRFKLYPHEDETTIFYYNLGSISTERKVDYKLGKVTDKDILNKIKNNDYLGFENLLSFVRDDENNLTSGQIKVNSISSHQPKLYEQTDLVEGGYYYIYLKLDDENGSYYQLDDVNLYQCLNNDGTLWLTDVYDEDFQWEEMDKLWDQFVEKYETTDVIKLYEELGHYVDITHTDNSLKSIFDDGSLRITANFTYKDGILTYVPLKEDEATIDALFNENLFIDNALDALADLKKYNLEKFNEWKKNFRNNSLTLEKDGIEYITEEYTIENDGATIKLDKISSFKLDIKYGLKTLDKIESEDKTPTNQPTLPKEESKTEEKVENPSTGRNIAYGLLVLIIMISGIVYLFVRKQSKFPKHN